MPPPPRGSCEKSPCVSGPQQSHAMLSLIRKLPGSTRARLPVQAGEWALRTNIKEQGADHSQKVEKVHLELQNQRITPLPEACSAGSGEVGREAGQTWERGERNTTGDRSYGYSDPGPRLFLEKSTRTQSPHPNDQTESPPSQGHAGITPSTLTANNIQPTL